MTPKPYCAVYDFELMPYALGDVLTWNVQTAIRCEELGRDRVDTYICMDERYPASVYQKDLVTAENSNLFFNELSGAFGTHPKPGNLFVFRRREELLESLRAAAKADALNEESLADYERALEKRGDEDALIAYFTKYIHSHEQINAFAAKHGRIPLLRTSLGCEPDVAGLLRTRFAGKRVVVAHMRLRRLDAGYGGEHTYARDSDFLEWYEFLREAESRHPDVQFVVVGRLQEKPLELLKLPNVTSLRVLGLGLGHELTLILRGDLFIGTSSGFAAMVNFSTVPYFITRMTPASCKAYHIEPGTLRLPFAADRQLLVYEPETREMLMNLLERGLAGVPPRSGNPPLGGTIDVRSWEWERSRWLHPGATTFRFFIDEHYGDKETAYLLWPEIRSIRSAWRRGSTDRAWALLERIEANFPRMCAKFPEFLEFQLALASARHDVQASERCKTNLANLALRKNEQGRLVRNVMRYLARGFPALSRLKSLWKRKHRIPKKLFGLAKQLTSPGSESRSESTTEYKKR